VAVSVEKLREWMPWALDEPTSLAERVELLRAFRARFDRDEDFVYGIFEGDQSAVVGGSGLHTRVGGDALEIGYWIRTDRTGAGLATEATAALTRVAFEVCGVDRVAIRVDPANVASRAIPRKLGFLEEATLRRRLAYPEPRDVVIYSLFRESFPGSPASVAAIEAFGASGTRVL
jgi:RimJ/RimL family protein N-acetyltransferase